MKKVVLICVSLILALALVSCGGNTTSTSEGYQPNQEVEGYAFTHGGYVGQAVITTDSTGAIDVTINEAFLPHTLAVVDMESDTWNEENTVYYVSRGSEVRVAKYVEYAGTVYVGQTVGSAVVWVAADENGEPAGGTDLDLVILRNQASMKAYYQNISSGEFKVYDSFGGMPTSIDTTAYGSLFKRNSGYWTNGQTWMGNISAIEEFVETHGSSYSFDEMVKASQENSDGLTPWSVADVVTGATASDFKDYFTLVLIASAQLK